MKRVRPFLVQEWRPAHIYAHAYVAGVRLCWCSNCDPQVYMHVFANCLIAQLRYHVAQAIVKNKLPYHSQHHHHHHS